MTRFGPKSDLSAPARLLYNDMTKEVCVSLSSYTSAHPDGLARGPPNLGLASYDANVLMYRLVALDYTPTQTQMVVLRHSQARGGVTGQ